MAVEHELIWYDGAKRSRSEVAERIEADVSSFLAARVDEFERDDSPWLLLIDELDVPRDVDELDEGTFSRRYAMQVSPDHFALQLSERLPRQLDAMYDVVVKQTWCSSARRRVGAIEFAVLGLEPAKAERIAHMISSLARSARHTIERGATSLALIAWADVPAGISSAMNQAIERVTAIETAKLRRLESACLG